MKWKLLEPIKIGKIEFRNRIVMPPICTRLATSRGVVTRPMIDYYLERAKGGVGLIIVEYSYIDTKASKGEPTQLGVYGDHLIAGLAELAKGVKAYGSRVALQICHNGRQTTPAIIGRQPVAPSAIPCKVSGFMPRELTIEEIEETTEAFGEAARRAKASEFDAVEIHGAHGYLLCQFLSPYTNKRTDSYGGDFEGRTKFPVEVIKRVREKAGFDFTVGYRMSAEEYVDGGLTLRETRSFAKILEEAGVNYIHVSAGIHESMHHMVQPTYLPRGYLIHLAKEIKDVVNVPVIAVGSIDPELGDQVLKDGKADMVSMGRTLIADPEIPKKLAEDRMEDVRPCIRCNECSASFREGKSLRCGVNAAAGREGECIIEPVREKKKVLIVGGGVAGLEAARIAALRGHGVILYEKEGHLGGHLVAASAPQFKEDLRKLMRWYSKQIRTRVKVQLKTGITPEIVKEINPDILILAVGSTPLIPDVQGVNRPIVTTAIDVLLGKLKIGKELVMVGGGFVGCETALYVAGKGKTVTIMETLNEIAADAELTTKMALSELLIKAGIRLLRGVKLKEITDEGAVGIDKEGETSFVKADNVVLALGLKPRKEIVKAFQGLAAEIFAIGDCVEPRKIIHAVREGFDVACKI